MQRKLFIALLYMRLSVLSLFMIATSAFSMRLPLQLLPDVIAEPILPPAEDLAPAIYDTIYDVMQTSEALPPVPGPTYERETVLAPVQGPAAQPAPELAPVPESALFLQNTQDTVPQPSLENEFLPVLPPADGLSNDSIPDEESVPPPAQGPTADDDADIVPATYNGPSPSPCTAASVPASNFAPLGPGLPGPIVMQEDGTLLSGPFQQVGGLGGICQQYDVCADAVWGQCIPGWGPVRQNKYYYQCIEIPGC